MRTGLTIIMMMFFASLALDLAVPAAILLALVAINAAFENLKRGPGGQGEVA